MPSSRGLSTTNDGTGGCRPGPSPGDPRRPGTESLANAKPKQQRWIWQPALPADGHKDCLTALRLTKTGMITRQERNFASHSRIYEAFASSGVLRFIVSGQFVCWMCVIVDEALGP